MFICFTAATYTVRPRVHCGDSTTSRKADECILNRVVVICALSASGMPCRGSIAIAAGRVAANFGIMPSPYAGARFAIRLIIHRRLATHRIICPRRQRRNLPEGEVERSLPFYVLRSSSNKDIRGGVKSRLLF